jgi:hypothetical protein
MMRLFVAILCTLLGSLQARRSGKLLPDADIHVQTHDEAIIPLFASKS